MKVKIPILIILASLLLVGVVDADAAPVAAFSANVTTGCAPLPVAFTDATTRSPINWDWYFWANETKSSDLQNPTYVFPAGTYNIRLYANTATHGDWENKSSYIATTGAPVAAFSGDPTSGDAPLSVTFTDASTNSPDNWDWYWSADEVKDSDTQSPAGESFAAGTYNVRLYVSNCGGAGNDWENKTGYITANTPAGGFDPTHYGNWTDFVVNSTSALTDYQVKMILDNRTGTSTTTLFYTNGTTRSTWEDVAWTDTSNATLGFWKENRTDTTTNTTWWIKVPSIANDNTTKIRLHYGNTSKTTSYMNMENTFPFADDFPGASINSSLWNVSTPASTTLTIANSIATLTAHTDSLLTPNAIWGKPLFGTNYVFMGRIKYKEHGANDFADFGWQNGVTQTLTAQFKVIYPNTGQLNALTRNPYPNEGSAALGTSYANNYYKYEVFRNGTTNAIFKIGGSTVGTVSSYVPTGTLNPLLEIDSKDGQQLDADWIVVRNYTVNEPFLTVNVTGGAAPPSVPVASFTINRIVARIPQSVTVTDTSTNTPTSWQWSWGDGTANSTTQNPSHSYTKRGKFDIYLTATNAGGSGSTATATSVRVVGYENYY